MLNIIKQHKKSLMAGLIISFLFFQIVIIPTFFIANAQSSTPIPPPPPMSGTPVPTLTVGPSIDPSQSGAPRHPGASNPNNTGDVPSANLSSFLQDILANFIVFKIRFIETVEGTLGGYFEIFAWAFAWVLAMAFFLQQFYYGKWDYKGVTTWTARLFACLFLIYSCGDLDGDGRKGDLVRTFTYSGYYLAFGQTEDEPTGGYINKIVLEEKETFNTNYQKFVENKLMVKIDENQFPVKYPGIKGVKTVAAVYTGSATQEQVNHFVTQEFWIGLLFQTLNIFRSLIELIDFFLLVVYAFSILVLTIIAPLMVCCFVHEGLAKRFTYPFFWTLFSICIAFPLISQGGRYFAYLCANFALGTNSTPSYTFDPTTNTIIANGDPTPIIIVAVLLMLVSALILVMSFSLSFALTQGRLLQSMVGLIANTFSGLTSTGMNAYFTGISTRMSAQGEKAVIEGTHASTMTRADATYQNQVISAENAKRVGDMTTDAQYQSGLLTAEGQLRSSELNAMGSHIASSMGVQATRVGTINNALVDFKHNLANMNIEEKTELANNLADLLSKNNDATSKAIAEQLRLQPENLGLLAEAYGDILNGVPIGGSVLNALGVNKDAINAWTRTDGVKSLGQYFLGNPQDGELNPGMFGKMFGEKPLSVQDPSAQQVFGKDHPYVFRRGDGTFVDAMTGKELELPKPPTTAGVYGASPAGVSQGSLQAFNRSLKPSDKRTIRANRRALQRVIQQDPNFIPTIQKFAAQNNINPDDILNMLAKESGFRKTVENNAGYLGLGQVGKKERRSMRRLGWTGNNSVDKARLRRMSYSQQLDSLIFPFMKQKLGRKLRGANLATIYSAWGSGHSTGNPNYVHMARGGKRAKAYRNNPAWDYNKDGKTQEWEFGMTPPKKLGAGYYFTINNGKKGQITPVKPRQGRQGVGRRASSAGGRGLSRPRPVRHALSNPRTPQVPTYAPSVLKIGQAARRNAQAVNSYVKNDGLKPPQRITKEQGIDFINKGRNKASQEYRAKEIAVETERRNALNNNYVDFNNRSKITKEKYDAKRKAEKSHTTDKIQVANQVADISQSGIDSQYEYSMAGANTMYDYSAAASAVTRDASLRANQMNYGTSLWTADNQHKAESKSAHIMRDASLYNLQQKNVATFLQAIGNSLSHQFSELFERASH